MTLRPNWSGCKYEDADVIKIGARCQCRSRSFCLINVQFSNNISFCLTFVSVLCLTSFCPESLKNWTKTGRPTLATTTTLIYSACFRYSPKQLFSRPAPRDYFAEKFAPTQSPSRRRLPPSLPPALLLCRILHNEYFTHVAKRPWFPVSTYYWSLSAL